MTSESNLVFCPKRIKSRFRQGQMFPLLFAWKTVQQSCITGFFFLLLVFLPRTPRRVCSSPFKPAAFGMVTSGPEEGLMKASGWCTIRPTHANLHSPSPLFGRSNHFVIFTHCMAHVARTRFSDNLYISVKFSMVMTGISSGQNRWILNRKGRALLPKLIHPSPACSLPCV